MINASNGQRASAYRGMRKSDDPFMGYRGTEHYTPSVKKQIAKNQPSWGAPVTPKRHKKPCLHCGLKFRNIGSHMRWCQSKNEDDSMESWTEEADDLGGDMVVEDALGDMEYDPIGTMLDDGTVDEGEDMAPPRKKQQRACRKCKKAIGVCAHPGRYGHLRFI